MDRLQLLHSTEWHDLPVDELAITAHGVSLLVTPFDDVSGAYRNLRLVIDTPDRIHFSTGTLANADLSRIEVSSLVVHEHVGPTISATLTLLLSGAGICSLECRASTWNLSEEPPAVVESERERQGVTNPPAHGEKSGSNVADSCVLAVPVPSLLPNGFRQAFATANTVLLAFALAFMRFWIFDPGAWKQRDVLEGAELFLAVVLLLTALFRALNVRDENPARYEVTRRILRLGVLAMFAAVIAAAIPDVM